MSKPIESVRDFARRMSLESTATLEREVATRDAAQKARWLEVVCDALDCLEYESNRSQDFARGAVRDAFKKAE